MAKKTETKDIGFNAIHPYNGGFLAATKTGIWLSKDGETWRRVEPKPWWRRAFRWLIGLALLALLLIAPLAGLFGCTPSPSITETTSVEARALLRIHQATRGSK